MSADVNKRSSARKAFWIWMNKTRRRPASGNRSSVSSAQTEMAYHRRGLSSVVCGEWKQKRNGHPWRVLDLLTGDSWSTRSRGIFTTVSTAASEAAYRNFLGWRNSVLRSILSCVTPTRQRTTPAVLICIHSYFYSRKWRSRVPCLLCKTKRLRGMIWACLKTKLSGYLMCPLR